MARTLSRIDTIIAERQNQLDTIRSQFQAQRDGLIAEIDQLRAIRRQITPEIEAVIVLLDNAIDL
jgi:uncharacterized coiled-coil DUF342 family protein